MTGPIITPPSAGQATLSRLYVRARAALAGLAREADAPSGLGDEDRAVARLLKASPTDAGGLRLDVASDGLDLAAKSRVEAAIRSHLGAGPGDLTVYFAKQAKAPAPGPAPVPEKKGAFGVTMARQPLAGVKRVIVVASGKGGVGKSTVSVNLAVALARAGETVGLLDADIYGPSAPLMMGLMTARPETMGEKLVPLAAHGVKVMSFGFLTNVEEPAIWRGPLIAKAFKQLAFDVEWGQLDTLVIDLPPGTGDVQLALIESLAVDGAVIVTTPQDVALIDAHKALSMFERLAVPVLGIVENMATFHCSQCGHAEDIFGAGGAERMAAMRKVPVLARIPLAGVVRARGDAGRPVVLDDAAPGSAAFAGLASSLLTGAQRVVSP